MLTADQIVNLLGLQPLAIEGGYYRETYRSATFIAADQRGGPHRGSRSLATAIYYLLTPDTCSALHLLPGDELFHFYLGDPVQMLQLHPDGRTERVTIGNDLAAGHRPQVLVPAGTWQGSRLVAGGAYALLGTTMSPGFDPADYRAADREQLLARYPREAELIAALTP